MSASELPWVSLTELAARRRAKEPTQAPPHEPAPAPYEPLAASHDLERRDFLRLAGTSMALAGASACTRQPDEKIVPYAASPESIVPGVPLYFATAMPWPGGALGLVVESHMGRPTKIEGNPQHPSSLGATDAIAQASLLDLYDPDRPQNLRHNGAIDTWTAFVAELAVAMEEQAARGGAGLRILTGAVVSPTLAQQIRDLLKAYPQARWHQWEPIHRDHARAGAMLAFGSDAAVQPRLERAEVVLSLDSDFLAGPAGVAAARHFSSARRARSSAKSLAKLFHVESSVSITGSVADRRLGATPATVAAIASAVARAVGIESAGGVLTGVERAFADEAAAALASHRGKSIVLAGREQPPEVHALAHAINDALRNVGNTLVYTDPAELESAGHGESLAQLAAELDAGRVEVLVTIDTNPLYSAPADLRFGESFRKAPLRIALAPYEDETAELSHWYVPMAHYLESWSDARAHDGTVSIVQPLIAPLYGAKTAHELVAALAGQGAAKPYDLVRAHWRSRLPEDEFESAWRRALHDGVIEGRSFPARNVPLRSPAPSTSKIGLDEGATVAVFRHDPATWDGRYANNAWLQECPRPLTKITWDNAALISPSLANELELESADLARIDVGEASIVAPVWVTPGHPERCVTLPLGYGRRHAGRTGTGVGFDAYKLRRSEQPWSSPARIRRAEGRHAFAVTQHHHDMERRDLVRVRTLEQLRAREAGASVSEPAAVHETTGHEAAAGHASLYPDVPYTGHAWGMVIDLNACIGCNACVVACQAENNIPVVGKEEVAIGREMHWLRIDRYYQGDEQDPEVLWQPIPCMHCEAAPCEVVCPVAATTHSPEGLNEMTYNRCVGTKYCSNNCPYKVRRFNYYLYNDRRTESLKLGRNPDVTVRSRGVMEKCTYCVQRIQERRIAARRDGRDIGGDEVATACQQVCPTEAILFGDVNDPNSRVAKLRGEPHHYGLLEELNTRPRTTYLARVRERGPEVAGAEHGEGGGEGR